MTHLLLGICFIGTAFFLLLGARNYLRFKKDSARREELFMKETLDELTRDR